MINTYLYVRSKQWKAKRGDQKCVFFFLSFTSSPFLALTWTCLIRLEEFTPSTRGAEGSSSVGAHDGYHALVSFMFLLFFSLLPKLWNYNPLGVQWRRKCFGREETKSFLSFVFAFVFPSPTPLPSPATPPPMLFSQPQDTLILSHSHTNSQREKFIATNSSLSTTWPIDVSL